MSLPLCFTDVIGLTRKADACIPSSFADTSESGLYMDELQGMSLRILNATGGVSTLLEKMANARENAINAFKIDVLKKILETKEPARDNFIGDIGGKSFTVPMAAYGYHGLRVYSDIIGGAYTLRGVTLILDSVEDITLEIWSGDDEETGAAVLHSIHLGNTLANRPKYFSITPIELPLSGNYFFLYQTSGAVPYNNKLTCNCGSHKWCFNIDRPCYNKSRDKWTEWAMAAGVHGTVADIGERNDWPTSREAEGLILHGDFGCDTMGILCSEHSDWTGNQVDAAIAWAILYKAGSFLSGYIMDSEEVNRYTLLGVDGLTANMVYYEERYKEMIEFIASNIEENRNECLKCRNNFGYRRQSQML
jgi:hypothetical protein